MKLNKEFNEGNLVIHLEGKLDINTVPELEKEFPDFSEIESIIFDFDRLEYISSYGLRFILKCKKQIDNTKVINCDSEVFDLFNVTGFTDMMEVEKKIREISVDNCDKIGEGFYGIIYKIDLETVVKVFKVPDSIKLIKREMELAKKAFVLYI